MWTLDDCTQVANNRLRGVAAGGGTGHVSRTFFWPTANISTHVLWFVT